MADPTYPAHTQCCTQRCDLKHQWRSISSSDPELWASKRADNHKGAEMKMRRTFDISPFFLRRLKIKTTGDQLGNFYGAFCCHLR